MDCITLGERIFFWPKNIFEEKGDGTSEIRMMLHGTSIYLHEYCMGQEGGVSVQGDNALNPRFSRLLVAILC